MKKNKLIEKNALKVLSTEQRMKLLALREKKQVGRFLLPDAPPRKMKKKETNSPELIKCPLIPGTPEVPPARVPQPWELKKRKITPEASGPFRYIEPDNDTVPDDEEAIASSSACQTPVKRARPSTAEVVMFTPSTGVTRSEDISNYQLVDSEVELVEFSDPVSPMPDAPSLPASSKPVSPMSSLLFDNNGEMDQEIREWESTIGQNPGSDVDDVEYEDIDLPLHASLLQRVNLPSTVELSPEVNEAIEALDKADDTALRSLATEDMLDFNWSSDPNIFTGQREIFTGVPGPTFNTEGLSPFQIFEKIWDADIISLIVKETNKYAEDIKNNPDLKNNASVKKWVPLTSEELLTFFSIIMFQSLLPIPVESEYWRPRYDYLKIGRFEDMMSFHRFKLIKRCLHFVDNLTISSSTNIAHKLVKILPIIEHLNNKFSSLYLPEQNIAVDESLLLWKGRLSFAQLINTKAARVGIKSYELCESKTGYLWKMKLYAGKGQDMPQEGGPGHDPEPEGATSKIVFELVRPLLFRGHTLVMDNFYNSPLLSRTLKDRKTDTMGTLRLNREFVPSSLQAKTKGNMSTGEVAFSQTKDMTIVVWKDSNLVSLISTYHPAKVGGKEKYGKYRYKPQVVLDYNLSMGGIDKKDQLLQAFPVERIRNQVWYKKLFRRLLNVSILNAHIIFGTGGTRLSSREFRSRLADEIFTRFRPLVPSTSKVMPAMSHFAMKNGKKKARCKLCTSKGLDSRTVWQCEKCGFNFCMPECFKQYHLENIL